MILARLDLKAYGRFTNTTLDLSAGPRRFHVVYGPNESGKSTSLRAITSLLFGIPHVTDDNFLHTNHQLRIGGRLVDEHHDLECIRRKGKKATLRDAEDDQAIDESILESMLGGISRESFLNRFGLTHHELVGGGNAIISGEGDLGQILFSAGAGIGRLREVQEELDLSASKIFTPRGTKTRVAKSLQQLDQQRDELKRAQVPPAAYRDLHQRLESYRSDAKQIASQLESTILQLNRLKHFQQALPLIPRWRSTLQSLAKFGNAPRLDEAFTERRRQTVSDREVARSRRAELEGRIVEMNRRLEGMPVDEAILRHQAEIQSVFQEVAARNKAERDREGLMRNRSNLDRKIAALLSQLSVDIKNDDAEEWSDAMEVAIEQLTVSDSKRNRIRQLAGSYEKLIGQRNDASDFVESTQRRLADVSDELDALGSPTDPVVVSNAIDAVGNPQSLLEAVTDQRENNEALKSRCEQLRGRLIGFDGNLDEAAALTLPNPTHLRSLSDAITASQQKLDEVVQSDSQSRSEYEALAMQLQRDRSECPLPTIAEVLEARQDRDDLTRRLQSFASQITKEDRDELGNQVEQLRLQTLRVDELTDTIRTHHQRFHEREQLHQRLNQLQEHRDKIAIKVAQAKADVEQAECQWRDAWTECSVAAADPVRMQRWIADHESFCQTMEQWRDGEKRMEQLQNRIQVASTRLRKALSRKSHTTMRSRESARAGAGNSIAGKSIGAKETVGVSFVQGGLFDEIPEDDLITLYDEAIAERSEANQKRQNHEALRRRREELAEEIPKAEIRLETAQRQVEQWREEWQRVTDSFAGSARIGTDEASLMLDQITDLQNKKRERDILVRRIRSIGDDETEFRSRVNQLIAATQCDLDPSRPPIVQAQELYQRLQAEQTSAQTRGTLREQIELSKQRMAEAESQQKACEAVLTELCKEAQSDSMGELPQPDELPQIEQMSKQRGELETELRGLENQLSLLAADQPLAEFIDQAAEQQPNLLDQQIDEFDANLHRQKEQQAELQQKIGAIQHELDKIDGSGNASEWIQAIQFTAGELNRDSEEYARAKIASLILRRAIERYRREHQSPILQHANKYFQQLTCNSYRELRPDYDAKGRTTLFGIQSDGDAVPATMMSDGTADALYLALRLASLEYQTGLSKPIPFIIDDCLIQLDDQRTAAALQAFSDLSETTQVILFTHHQHLVELARESLPDNAYHIHQLA